jgi:5-epi-alpha-selinene synthase
MNEYRHLPRPSLNCPFPSASSPYRDWAESENFEWLRRFGFFATRERVERVRRARFGWLAARAYPNASIEGLGIAAAWASWLFMRDDLCDEAGMACDPPAMRALSDHLLAVLAGLAAPDKSDSLAQSLADLRRRMIESGGAPWLSRFLTNVQDYFEACVWEATNRQRGEVPEIETYQRMRDLTGAVKTCFDIYELAGGSSLPVEARHHPILTRMMQVANRVICWSNDIFSLEKELRHDDCHNLVIVLHRTCSMPLDHAVLNAAQIHDLEVAAFVTLENQLLAERLVSPEMTRFVSALKGWMRANLDWSLETGRYACDGAVSSGDSRLLAMSAISS